MAKNSKDNKFRKVVIKVLNISIIGFVLISSVFALLLFNEWYQNSHEFDLKKVKVVSNRLLSEEEVIKLSSLKNGVRIVDLNLTSIRDRINGSSYVKDCRVKLVLPATVEISLEEEIPVAILIKDGKLQYISELNQIIGLCKAKNSYNLPLINGNISKRVTAFLGQTMELSPFFYHQISEVWEDDNGLMLSLVKNSVPVVVGREDFAEKITVMESFLTEEYKRLDFSHLLYIDLRFDNQVVVKENTIEEKPVEVKENSIALNEPKIQ